MREDAALVGNELFSESAASFFSHWGPSMLAELIGSTGSLGFVKVHPATTLIQYKGSAYVFGGVHRNNAAQFQLAIVIKHVFKLSNAPDAE